MFSSKLGAIKLKQDFKEKFRNISRIMDCVGCDKCRLWGKVQVGFLSLSFANVKSITHIPDARPWDRSKDPVFRQNQPLHSSDQVFRKTAIHAEQNRDRDII